MSAKCYYSYLKGPGKKELEDMRLLSMIKEIQEEHHSGIGYRKMAALISSRTGNTVNSKRIERLMRENGLLSAVRRKRYSDEAYERRREILRNKPEDIIKRDFSAPAPGMRFVEDITYLPTIEGTKYLNTIEDLYNGEIAAWSISDHPDSALCTETVRKLAIRLNGRTEGIIIHSDEGSSYASYAYRDFCRELGIIVSMGKVCYDNAAMESLNGIIKTESLYCRFGKTRVNNKQIDAESIIEATEEFIRFYNEERPKAALGFISPVQFRLLHQDKSPIPVDTSLQ